MRQRVVYLVWNGVLGGLLGFMPALSLTAISQESSQFYEQAQEKFGKPSRVWFVQPGDTGLGTWEQRGLFDEEGIVLNWDSQNLVLVRPNANAASTFPMDEVIRIEPSWMSEKGAQVHEHFLKREFDSVLSKGQEALGSGIPRWQQRLITAEMVEAASGTNKSSVAVKVFLYLANENPPQLMLATIPIPWSDEAAREGGGVTKLQKDALEWLKSENESIQLLGASWSLGGAARPLAIEALEKLSKSQRPIIATYARAQLWRTIPPAEIFSEHYPRWVAERDKLLAPVQAGPTMLMADRLLQAGQPTLAVAEWLRVVTLHNDRHHLAVKAAASAVDALRSIDRNADADQIVKAYAPLFKKKP